MSQTLTEAQIVDLLPEISLIADGTLRAGVISIWQDIAEEMEWSALTDIPKNNTTEKHRSLVGHIRGVTQMAVEICEIARRMHDRSYDRDLLLAACLLHDVSKPVEAAPVHENARSDAGLLSGKSSRLGKNLPHAVYAVHKVLEKRLPVELANLVATHTHSSNVRGTTWEAAAIFYADFADSDAARSMAGSKMYSERWILG